MKPRDKVQHLPAKPGVYIFKDSQDTVIYVGKAVNLRNRVRTYFQAAGRQSPKVKAMVERAADLEYIQTDSEVEALILECNLIKEHRPRYNVCLKDDKSYPYIKVSLNETFPRVYSTRRVVKDGARYFGPYTAVGAMRETLGLLRKIFPIRTCKPQEMARRSRPCLNYHIKRCLGPCCGLVDQEQYRRSIQEVVLFLEGRQADLVHRLQQRMAEAAENLQFEQAAELRDQLQAVQKVMEKQKIVSAGLEDQDVIAMARGIKSESCLMVFFVRGGKLIGREHFLIDDTGDMDRSEVMTGFVKQYYSQSESWPKVILLSEEIEDGELISCWLSEKKGEKVQVRVPKRGDKLKLVEMAAKNALLTLEQEQLERQSRLDRVEGALEELARWLNLDQPPRRMECYDISNIQGSETVASMVVFEEGVAKNSEYRRFKIKTVQGPNDFASMQEVINRRFSRAIEEIKLINTGQLSTKEAKFYRLPDLVIIDGGKGQLSSAREVMRLLGFGYIPTFGLAKEEELLFTEGNPDPIVLPRGGKALYLVQRLRDEAHRFAITYHRQLRGKRNLKSLLDEIDGIGDKRRRELLKAFKNIDQIKAAPVEELAIVEGMNKPAAQAVYDFFHDREQQG